MQGRKIKPSRHTPRIQSQNRNGSKCSVRDLGQRDLCKKLIHCHVPLIAVYCRAGQCCQQFNFSGALLWKKYIKKHKIVLNNLKKFTVNNALKIISTDIATHLFNMVKRLPKSVHNAVKMFARKVLKTNRPVFIRLGLHILPDFFLLRTLYFEWLYVC